MKRDFIPQAFTRREANGELIAQDKVAEASARHLSSSQWRCRFDVPPPRCSYLVPENVIIRDSIFSKLELNAAIASLEKKNS
eukprot:6815460-Prorocentrum_lima.AAC.1